jgi:hypothetical protein
MTLRFSAKLATAVQQDSIKPSSIKIYISKKDNNCRYFVEMLCHDVNIHHKQDTAVGVVVVADSIDST